MSTVRLKEFDDFIWTRTLCDCGQPNCYVDILFEYDQDGYTSISLEGEFRTYAMYKHRGWFRRQWWKIKTIVKLIFTNNIELSTDIILDRNNSQKFLEIVQECSEEVKK